MRYLGIASLRAMSFAPHPAAYEIDWAAILNLVIVLALLPVGIFGLIKFFAMVNRNSVAAQAYRQAQAKARWDSLVGRFGVDAANGILRRQFWKGQTLEMLMEARGRPIAIDNEVMKTKTRQVLKYEMIAAGRFRLKITVEDGIVVGWEQKAG